MDTHTFSALTSLPLLQGVSATDLHRLLDNSLLQIEALDPGELWFAKGDVCSHLIFLLDGEMNVETPSPDGTYILRETINGPAVLEPEILYGIQRTWSSNISSLTECHLMGIPKSDVSRMIVSFEVFRLNYLNLLSTLSIKRKWNAWQNSELNGNLEQRFSTFISQISSYKTGAKQLRIKASTLGQILGAHRTLISKMLDEMESKGLLHHGRGYIDIPDLYNLSK